MIGVRTATFSALLLLSTHSWADAATDEKATKRPRANESVDADEVAADAQPSADFWSYFSAGLLLNYMGTDRIDSAVIRDGIVRVEKRSQFSAGIGLQAYYPVGKWTYLRSSDFLPKDSPNKKWSKYSEWGFGPYVGVSLATSDVIDVIAVGVAFSLQRREGGVRLGLGLAFDPDAQKLASDFKEDAPAPANATSVKYTQGVAVGGQLMITFTPGFSD